MSLNIALHYFDKVSLLQNCSEYKNEFDNNVAYNVITYITITITYGVAFYEDYEILITKVKYVRMCVYNNDTCSLPNGVIFMINSFLRMKKQIF